MPWGFPLQMSKALRDFLTAVRASRAPTASRTAGQGRIPCRAIPQPRLYRLLRDRPRTAGYLPRPDERHLVPAIDAQLAELDGKRDPLLAKLKTRWDFLRVALRT